MSTIYHTPISVGAPVNAAIVNAPLSSLDTAINNANTNITTNTTAIANILAGATGFTQLSLGTTSDKTIAGGIITADKSRHRLDTEGAAATDDLDTISGGAAGDVLRISIVNGARIVRLKHNTGNIYLASEADLWLDSTSKFIDLMYDANVSKWVQDLQHPIIRGVISSTQYPLVKMKVPDSLITVSGGQSANNTPFLSIQPRPDKRTFFAEFASAALLESIGMAAGTNAGAGAVTNSNQTDSRYINQAIANVAGTFGGRRSSTFNLTRRQYNPYFAVLMRTSTDITNIRFWIGLTQAQVTNVDTLAAATAFIGFRYSTVAADPAWMAVTNSGAAQSTLTTGVGATISTAYLFEVYVDDANGICYFSVNGSTPVSLNTNLPGATQDLGWTVSAITTTATAKNILISRVYSDSN